MELTRDDYPFIDDLSVGESFDGFFVLRSFQMGTTRANKPFLIMDMTDRTGHIKAKLWEDADIAYQQLKQGRVVKIRAMVEEYLGKAELKIVRIRMVDEIDIQDYSRFLPTSERDSKEDVEIILNAIKIIIHPGIQALLNHLFEGKEFLQAFETAPAGKKWHHGYLGGLAEHTASMVQLAISISEHYPDLNRDILIAGAILHDIGKIWELIYETNIEYSVRGRLEGHITIGVQYLNDIAKDIEELDEENLTLIKHMILSHQGSRENGCPVEPMTKEAFVLYYIDEIDSKLNAINRELGKVENSDSDFTPFIPLLNRMLYKGISEDQ